MCCETQYSPEGFNRMLETRLLRWMADNHCRSIVGDRFSSYCARDTIAKAQKGSKSHSLIGYMDYEIASAERLHSGRGTVAQDNTQQKPQKQLLG